MTVPVRVNTTAEFELGRYAVDEWINVASVRRAFIAPIDREDGRGARIRFTTDLGALADTAEVIVPFTDLAEFVDQVRDGDLDGFEDALDHRPPRGRSRKYIDAYTLGEVEARGRAQ
ncbi:hypothetical protein PP504_gp53 [Gordonia phage Dolores]|uniref:Uncharacterized protein n=2 Tax=Beenievirus TaxID=3044673 RepID=A0A514DIF0_9CAUD|nr:hypothetical protein PP503_gp53 [Gordonia phage Sekhmet]YP_010654220.1 hypothetical protein PP504_gp53 [Gordonia phage Dolores]QDH93391.1 hypothetical protein SEA_SEKHMET_53 [Gordonia phage Sekhmet]UAJ16484.1 hypothetical protein SEA_DOLORES_53 [Gordonia phage Dolores]URM87950.1 hypothetical protein SEA_WINKNICK_54 [Gordonia phage WinkNick]